MRETTLLLTPKLQNSCQGKNFEAGSRVQCKLTDSVYVARILTTGTKKIHCFLQASLLSYTFVGYNSRFGASTFKLRLRLCWLCERHSYERAHF